MFFNCSRHVPVDLSQRRELSPQAAEPAHLKPGALVGHLGRAALVEDVLWVK